MLFGAAAQASAQQVPGASGDRIPVGAVEYARLTEQLTTLPLSPDEIRETAQRELDGALAGLGIVMEEVGFEGTTEEFFEFLRTDDRFYHPDTDEGRAAYLAEARRVAAEMAERLDELVEPPPTLTALDAMELPASYPPWTAAAIASPGMRFTPSDPPLEIGALLFDLDDMRSAPTFAIPVLAYHEGVPGHHLQGTIEIGEFGSRQNIPVYVEGWASYAMMLPKELGFFQDPYAEAGRLSVSAGAAARVLADVGLHVDGWTREEAVAFLLANTPATERRAQLDVERALARPATMSAYLVGMLKFQELRARAEAALGNGFDLRAFHHELLWPGQASLPDLEARIDAWIADTAAAR